MWMYTGSDDPTRISEEDISTEDLKNKVRRLTKLTKNDKILLKPLQKPFEVSHQPEAVSATKYLPIKIHLPIYFSYRFADIYFLLVLQELAVDMSYPPRPE